MNLIPRVSDLLSMLVNLVGLQALTNTLTVMLIHLKEISQILKNSDNLMISVYDAFAMQSKCHQKLYKALKHIFLTLSTHFLF